MALRKYDPFDDWLVDNGCSADRTGVSDHTGVLDHTGDDVMYVSELEPDEIDLLNFWRDFDYAAILVMIVEYV